MATRRLRRPWLDRPLLAGLLACSMTLGACATLEPSADAGFAGTAAPGTGATGATATTAAAQAPAENAATAPAAGTTTGDAARNAPAAAWVGDAERAAQFGIAVLAPAQPLPVTPAALSESRPLDLDAMPCQLSPAEGLVDSTVQPAGAFGAGKRSEGPDDTGTVDAGADAVVPAPLPVQCANLFPDIPDVPRQRYTFGLETRDPAPGGSVMVVTGVGQRAHPAFAVSGTQQGFSFSGGRWTYRDSAGPTLALGHLTANAPLWGSAVPIGGLQVSDWAGGMQVVPSGRLAYSSAVGVLNYTDTAARSGAIDYGVTAGSGTLRYGLTPVLTLESQVQTAPDIATRGLGTTYSAGDLGTFQLGATQSTFDSVNAWRYRFGYNVNLLESVSLAVTNEQIDAGFGDLAQYRDGAVSAPRMRNTLAAGIPISGWGTVTGTYTGLRESGVAIEQRFGLQHSMLVAPSVRLAVGADRDVVTGDYEMRAGLTMPVDAFMLGRWLPW